MKYKVCAVLPRTGEKVTLVETTIEADATKVANKNIKYFPKIVISSGMQSLGNYSEEILENAAFRDRSRDVIVDSKIGRIKRKPKFSNRIVFEDDNKVMFLIRFKKNESRICIIDADQKEKVFSLLKLPSDCYRTKIYRGALPLVYFRVHSKKHIIMPELLYDKKKFGYMVFRDGNPYNYMRDNIIFRTRYAVRRNEKPSTGYYGVTFERHRGKKPYVTKIVNDNGKRSAVAYFDNPLSAAKEYDRRMMEKYGKSAAKNFPYEYYAAFEPNYTRNVT